MKIGLWFVIIVAFAGVLWLFPPGTPAAAQQPTGNIPTVTGTASTNPFITVNNPDGANVRAGPSSYDYAMIDFLPEGSTAPAIGKSPAGEWIQIIDLSVPGGVGWVYAPLVMLSPGSLPIVEPPPTATPPPGSTASGSTRTGARTWCITCATTTAARLAPW